MRETRENIKNRMLKTAARIWGLPGVEQETSFDPLVEMLINACASEIEKVSREINISQSRLVEKLAQILAPDTEIGAIPAHAIAFAEPMEHHSTISERQQLLFQKKNINSHTEAKDIYFNPTSDFTLTKGELKYMVAKDSFFEIIENRYKEQLIQTTPSKQIKNSSLFLGLSIDKTVSKIDNLSIYFELRNESFQEQFYHYLKLSKWYLGDKKLDGNPGFANNISGEDLELEDILEKNFRIADRTSQHINHFYKKKFFTVRNLDGLNSYKRKYPKALEAVFDAKMLEGLDSNLIWIEVQFSEVLSGEVLKEVISAINCFPVVNRKYNEFTFRLQQNLNIIPLRSDEFFFDIKSVTDTDGSNYHLKNSDDKWDLANAEMILRTSGVGRFDSRDASELIHYLLEAFRDESAAFSMLGAEAITNSVVELNKAIGSLEDKVSKIPVQEGLSYIMIRSAEANRNLFVEFWSTAGVVGNGVKPGSVLDSIKGIDLKNKSAVMLTPSLGGRNRLSEEERLDVYKKSLISKEKIVTTQDLKSLCYHHFGTRIRKVEINRGVGKSLSRKSGLTRTVDLILTPNTDLFTSKEEWQHMFNDLRVKLEKSANNTFPYRFLIKEEEQS